MTRAADSRHLVQLACWIDRDLKARLDERAREQKKRQAEVVTEALEGFLGEQERNSLTGGDMGGVGSANE